MKNKVKKYCCLSLFGMFAIINYIWPLMLVSIIIMMVMFIQIINQHSFLNQTSNQQFMHFIVPQIRMHSIINIKNNYIYAKDLLYIKEIQPFSCSPSGSQIITQTIEFQGQGYFFMDHINQVITIQGTDNEITVNSIKYNCSSLCQIDVNDYLNIQTHNAVIKMTFNSYNLSTCTLLRSNQDVQGNIIYIQFPNTTTQPTVILGDYVLNMSLTTQKTLFLLVGFSMINGILIMINLFIQLLLCKKRGFTKAFCPLHTLINEAKRQSKLKKYLFEQTKTSIV